LSSPATDLPSAAGGLSSLELAPAGTAEPSSVRLSAFTVDVEDWYQSCVDLDAPITERVVRNVHSIIELLDGAGIKGSFFVQGMVAETFPALMEQLVAEGHEIQSHGYSHRSLHAMTREELRRELEYSKKSVEDACGTSVTAFRAPDFSILESNLWALEELAEAGFTVDSSIFPAKAPRYGIAEWDIGPRRVGLPNGAAILEVPVAIWPVAGMRVPVAGGGYFRALPRTVLERGIRAVRDDGRPAIMYCHPYEFSPRELDDYRGQIPTRQRLSQSLGRGASIKRMRSLLERLPFGRFDDTLSSWGIPMSPGA
jgi:polysaccharide deacetylase family protein (PEP-CTERM system associated)